jgi:NCS2 family nucleobase:cation symporter-2
MKRPVGLLYAAGETPPPTILAFSALQHMAVMAVTLVFPIIIAREAGLTGIQRTDAVSLAMLAIGVATILLCLKSRFIGSGYLVPAGFTGIYLGPSLFALQQGGLALLLGMTVVAGVIQFAIAPLLRRLRPLLPPEIAGLVIAIIGLSLAVLGVRYGLGISDDRTVRPAYCAVAGIALATMVVLNVWATGPLKMFCALIGIAVGFAASIVLGVFDPSTLAPHEGSGLLRLPEVGFAGWAVDISLLAPFAVAAIAATLRVMGDVSNAQRLDDADWVRPNFGSLTTAVTANGVASAFCGMVGSPGINSYSASIGMAGATGIASRSVGYAAGAAFAVLAFVPAAGAAFAAMPVPVMGAVLFFVSAFIFTSGMQMVTARMLDARKTTVIGFSFAMAVMADIYHDVFAGVPQLLKPIFDNSLVLGTVCAILLNLIMRIGVRRRVALTLNPLQLNREAVEQFLFENGARWAARRDIVTRAVFGVVQVLEVIGQPAGDVEIEARFDEFNLNVRVRYPGSPLLVPETRPTPREIVASEDGERRLAGYLLRRSADRISCRASGERAEVDLHYDH